MFVYNNTASDFYKNERFKQRKVIREKSVVKTTSVKKLKKTKLTKKNINFLKSLGLKVLS